MLWLRPGELCVLLAYACLVFACVPFHEPWADEAQAWLLARDLSVPSLLFHFLRREGHPALWYLLLWGPTHLHVSYAILNWISALIALAGIWVLLRLAPFPFYLRALLPFTFFLGYQYSVVARSYVLFPLLSFLAAHFYRQRKPMSLAIALGLLANVSLHGTIVAIAFVAAYWIAARRTPGRFSSRPALVFAAFVVFAAVCIWPTLGSLPRVGPTLNRIVDRLSIGPHPTPPPAVAISPANAAAPVLATPAEPLPGRDKLATVPSVLSLGVAHPWLVAVAFELLVVVYLIWRRQPALLLAPLCLALFLIFVYAAEWHMGLVWIALLMVLWAAWDTPAAAARFDLQCIVAGVVTVLCVLQLPWTFHAFAYDFREPTSPNPAAAAYIKALPPGTRIAGFGRSVGIEPYFPANILLNQRVTFGNSGLPMYFTPDEARAHGIQVIVTDQFQAAEIEAAGYRESHEFCGALYFPYVRFQQHCLGVFELPR